MKMVKSDISDEQMYDYVRSVQGIASTVLSLITGFTYIVLSQPKVEYQVSKFVEADRANVVAACTIFAFGFSLAGLIISGIMYGWASAGGPKHIRSFVSKFRKTNDQPNRFLLLSILTMLLSSFIHVGGIYNDAVYYVLVVFYIILIFYIFRIIVQLHAWNYEWLEKLKEPIVNKEEQVATL